MFVIDKNSSHVPLRSGYPVDRTRGGTPTPITITPRKTITRTRNCSDPRRCCALKPLHEPRHDQIRFVVSEPTSRGVRFGKDGMDELWDQTSRSITPPQQAARKFTKQIGLM